MCECAHVTSHIEHCPVMCLKFRLLGRVRSPSPSVGLSLSVSSFEVTILRYYEFNVQLGPGQLEIVYF